MQPMPSRHRRPELRRLVRGQAMVEYSMINWVLIVGLLLLSQARMVPDGNGNQQNLIDLFLSAYQVYYDSFYFVLNLPFP